SVDDTHVGNAADHQEQTNQQAQGLKVNGHQRTGNSLQILLLGVVVDQTHYQQGAADHTVDCFGQIPAVGSEGGADQQADGAQQQSGGNIVADLSHLAGLGNSALLLAE